MKKAILSIFCIVLIVMAIPTFVACNEKEEFVTVSVYVVDNGNLQKTPIVINKKKGERIKFYTDDEMQNELDIDDKPLSELGLKIIGMFYSLSTTIYVKQV